MGGPAPVGITVESPRTPRVQPARPARDDGGQAKTPEAVPYEIEEPSQVGVESTRSYIAILQKPLPPEEKARALLQARREYVNVILLKLRQAGLINLDNYDECFSDDDCLGSRIEELVDDRDFDGYFDLDFEALSQILDREKQLLIETVIGKGYSCTNYFSDFSHPAVVAYAAANGFPWSTDHFEKTTDQVAASARQNDPTSGAPFRYEQEKAAHKKSRDFLRTSSFFNGVSDPANLEQVTGYFAKKYGAELATSTSLQQQFIQELAAVKDYLFCAAWVEENDRPIDRPTSQINVEDAFILTSANLQKLSKNHWGQFRADCDLLMKFDAAVFSAVGLDAYYVPVRILSADGAGHGQAVGLLPGSYQAARGEEIPVDGAYFVSNNFDVFMVSPSHIYSSKKPNEPQVISGDQAVSTGVKAALALSLGVSANSIVVYALERTESSFAGNFSSAAICRTEVEMGLYSAMTTFRALHGTAAVFLSQSTDAQIAAAIQARTSSPKTWIKEVREDFEFSRGQLSTAKQLLSDAQDNEITFPIKYEFDLNGTKITLRWQDRASAIQGIEKLIQLCDRILSRIDAVGKLIEDTQ
jgi:hypothetical protein